MYYFVDKILRNTSYAFLSIINPFEHDFDLTTASDLKIIDLNFLYVQIL